MMPGVPKTIDHPKKMPSAVVARNLHLRLSQRQHSENIIAHITRQQLQNREILQGRWHWRFVQNFEARIEHQRYWSNISSLNCVISAAGHAVRVRRGGSEGIGNGRGFAIAARKSPFYGQTIHHDDTFEVVYLYFSAPSIFDLNWERVSFALWRESKNIRGWKMFLEPKCPSEITLSPISTTVKTLNAMSACLSIMHSTDYIHGST